MNVLDPDDEKLGFASRPSGIIAHEFNNILGIIQGNAELLAERGNTDPLLQAILRAAARGEAVTRKLLAFSGRLPLQPLSVDLGILLEGMRGALGDLLGDQIELRIGPSPAMSRVYVDRDMFAYAIELLAENAREAMPPGGVFSISCENAVADRDVTGHEDSDCR